MILEVFLLIIGTTFLVVGARKLQSSIWLRNNGTTTWGYVSAVLKEKKRDSDDYLQTYYTPVIAFETHNGEKIEQKLDISTSLNEYQEGMDVKVIYDPDDPQDCNIESTNRMIFLPWVFIILGLGQFVLAALSYLEFIEL